MIGYHQRLMAMPARRLPRLAYFHALSLPATARSWAQQLDEWLRKPTLCFLHSPLTLNSSGAGPASIKSLVRSRTLRAVDLLSNEYVEAVIQDPSVKVSTYMFSCYTGQWRYQEYLSQTPSSSVLRCLARFRLGSYHLAIETGRWRNISRPERICICCSLGCVEDERHFLLQCLLYTHVRKKYEVLFPSVVSDVSAFWRYNAAHIRCIGAYVHECMGLRSAYMVNEREREREDITSNPAAKG